MHNNSDKAGQFVVVGQFSGDRDREGVSDGMTTKAIVVNPETTVKEIFAAFWPADTEEYSTERILFNAPLRLEIMPDEETTPEREGIKLGDYK